MMKALFRLLLAQSPVGTWKMSVPDENGKMTPVQVGLSGDGTYAVDFGAKFQHPAPGPHRPR